MGMKMRNAPLYFTVGQVQFNPILNLNTYLPAIQVKMREMHFPDFQQEAVQELILPFSTSSGSQAAPSFAHRLRYKFGDIDGWESFFIDQNQLLFQTTRYQTFEAFLSNMMKVLSILHDVIHLDFIERLGLRYLDAVQPSAGESLSQYLIPEVLGLYKKLGGDLSHSISETMTITPAGQLMARIVIQNGKIGMPADLAGISNKFSEKITAYDGLHAIIDNDASYIQRMPFELNSIETKLTTLHDAIKAAFEMSVTDHAMASWA